MLGDKPVGAEEGVLHRDVLGGDGSLYPSVQSFRWDTGAMSASLLAMASDGDLFRLVYGDEDDDDRRDEFLITFAGLISDLSDPILLAGLAWARFSITQAAVARNPHSPGELLAEIAADPWSADSALAVAENPRTPVPALRLLESGDYADYVREAAAANLARRPPTISDSE